MTDTKGRPVERGQVKRVTLELPAELWEEITKRSKNRTQWIIKALNAQLEQEQAQEEYMTSLKAASAKWRKS